MKQILTLAYLVKEDLICLGLKKRGLGKGNWNGFGGKVESGEVIEVGAVRELREESGVIAIERDLERVAIIEFFFTNGTHLEVHTFFIRTWKGEPSETEEMRPKWFLHSELPFELMWADDPHWLPRALAGEKLIGKVWFKEDGKTIEKMEWRVTSKTTDYRHTL